MNIEKRINNTVDAFAKSMKEKLITRTVEKGYREWNEFGILELYKSLQDEAGELLEAIEKLRKIKEDVSITEGLNCISDVFLESVNVANFAMMIADNVSERIPDFGKRR